MGIDYDIVKADIINILPNFLNYKIAFIARDESGREHIFKPSWIGHHHNANEYIAHHIASLIGAPVPEGSFLKISANNMQMWHEIIKTFHPDAVFPTFIPPYENAIFFAVEFKKGSISAKSITDLMMELNTSTNKDKFYSQFSLDQYLRNPDRHLGNHIFFQESHKKVFNLIDFDRIFNAATDWSRVSSDIDDFGCFADVGYNKDLYTIVKNEHIRTVHSYAGYIEKISYENIEEICKNTSYVYGIDKDSYDKLLQWLLYRKDKIHESCLKNEHCFKTVTKRGYLSADR